MGILYRFQRFAIADKIRSLFPFLSTVCGAKRTSMESYYFHISSPLNILVHLLLPVIHVPDRVRRATLPGLPLNLTVFITQI